MKGKAPMRRVAYSAALAAMAVSLAGCQSFRQAAGLTKQPPDEFAVVTKAPLVVPPDYNLRPPLPGAAPTNQVAPTEAAEGSLYGSPQDDTGVKGQLSSAERNLLTKADAGDANNMIRQQIAADNKAMQVSDESFTNRLLFGWGGSDNASGKALDANAEEKRLEALKRGDKSAKPPAKSSNEPSIKKDSGGWLDGLF